MDKIDREILKIIQKDAKTPNAEIARSLGMAPSGIHERIKKLESAKIILGYETRLNHKMAGMPLTTFIQVHTDERLGVVEIGQKIAELPEVQEVHAVTGKFAYLVKARVKDSDHHNDLLKRMGELGAMDARTTVVLETMKETLKLNLE